MKRVTVSMPDNLVEEIEEWTSEDSAHDHPTLQFVSVSQFVQIAVRHYLDFLEEEESGDDDQDQGEE